MEMFERPPMTTEYRLIQDGQIVVKVMGPDNKIVQEIRHYAAVYSQDGPVTIQFHSESGRWVTVTEPSHDH